MRWSWSPILFFAGILSLSVLLAVGSVESVIVLVCFIAFASITLLTGSVNFKDSARP